MRKNFFIILIFLISCKDKLEETKPTIGNITESVYASGTVKSENQYTNLEWNDFEGVFYDGKTYARFSEFYELYKYVIKS